MLSPVRPDARSAYRIEASGSVTSPLRVTLLKRFMTELLARVDKASQDGSTLNALKKVGWVKQVDLEELQWTYFTYNPSKKEEEVDTTKMPLSNGSSSTCYRPLWNS